MAEEKCADCRFWRDGERGVDVSVALGSCRRYPPVLMPREEVAELFCGGETFPEGMWNRSQFPRSVGDAWCGEFQPKGRANG